MKLLRRVLIMGDSVSVGVGDCGTNFEGPGWGMRIAEMIGAERILNIAANGTKVADFSSSQSQIASFFQPDLVIVSVGSNDILRANFDVNRILTELKESFERINQTGCIVLLLVPPDPLNSAPAPKFLREALSIRHKQLLEVFKMLEKISLVNLILITPEEIMQRKNLWHIDRMHPSPLGHQYLAMKSIGFLGIYPHKILDTEDSGRSLKHKLFWLLIAGSMWILKRSIDLIPSLIWIGIKLKYLRRFQPDSSSASLTAS